MPAAYVFDAELWEWPARASWFFVSVPEAISDEIDARTNVFAAGFTSVRVCDSALSTNAARQGSSCLY